MLLRSCAAAPRLLVRLPTHFDAAQILQRLLSSRSSSVLDLRFSHGLFRLKAEKQFVLSYFTPLRTVLKELRDEDDKPNDDDVKVIAYDRDQPSEIGKHMLLGDVILKHRHCVIDFGDKTLKLKFKGSPDELTAWSTVEPRRAQEAENGQDELLKQRQMLMVEFAPMLAAYTKIMEQAKWRDLVPLAFHGALLGGLTYLIFIKLGWDVMEPVTWTISGIILIMSHTYLFHPLAHYANCGRKLRMMRSIHTLCRKRNFDLERFKRVADHLFHIDDQLNAKITTQRLAHRCGSMF